MTKAFSLVELSIVLVILGLLVGGVLSGQSLIRAAELRSVNTEYSKYTAAVYSFKDKYFQIPGDMNNAVSFWTSVGGTGSDATCQNTASTGQATCNGDGNGNLVNAAVSNAEQFRFWQHLANAGLIEGQYTGVAGATAQQLPPSKLSSAAWRARQPFNGIGQDPGSLNTFGGSFGNNIFFFTSMAGCCALTPEEAWNIDTKLDDGVINKGKVIGLKGNSPVGCSNVGNQAEGSYTNAQYLLSNKSKDCYIIFVDAF